MIQVTLNDSHFNHSGTHNKRPFDSLQIRHISNGRVYFTAITNGIRMFEVIKQMQLVDGKVIISFSKNDKIEIGTYSKAS